VLSGDVSGLIDGLGGSLVKVGKGTLKLSGANNTYSGGTTIKQGTLDLAAVGAAGTGDIKFKGAGKELKVLKIENGALSGHALGNPIDFFAKHDVLDLSGLHFHVGATATYHKATHHLTVHSGSVTDTLTLLSPHGTSFAVANDGHGGTKVTLDPPAPTAHAVASMSTHDSSGQDWTPGANHPADFLLVA
jgi:autotransporter-associated beta strand protein